MRPVWPPRRSDRGSVSASASTPHEDTDVEQVAVRVEGEAVEVPRDDGTLTSDPLTRADYRTFSPS
jgi:hypothetical protein